MYRWGSLFVLSGLLAAGPAAAVGRGQDGGDKSVPVQEQLQRLEGTLKKAFDKVAEEIKALHRDLSATKEDRAEVQSKLQAALGKITSLERLVSEMKNDIDALKGKPAPRVALYPPDAPPPAEDLGARLARLEQALAGGPSPGRVSVHAAGANGEKVRQLQEQLEHIDATTKRAFDRLHEDLGSLRRELKGCQDDRFEGRLRLETANATLTSLQPQLAALRAEVETLRRTPAPATVAYYPPAAPSYVALSPPQTGRLVLVNNYTEEMIFNVNGRTYRVAAGMSLPLEGFPAGVLSYQVISPTWGVRGSNTTTLAAGETFTVTAR